MTDSVRENLIGYIVGAIEPEERLQVEQRVEQDASTRQELELMRSGLHPLAEDQMHHEPPAGLAQRCCDYVYSRAEVLPASLSPASQAPRKVVRWTRLELGVAGAIAASVAIFFLPQIYQTHVQSQLLACQSNLKDIGFAAGKYTEQNGGYYPAARPGDRTNYVGMWEPMMVSQHYLPSGNSLVCPSSPEADAGQFHSLTAEDVKAMNDARLAQMLPQLSPSYGMTMGYLQDGKYKVQRNQNREKFAVISDNPGPNGTNSPNHGGRGTNVLWDDFHTSFLTSPEVGPNGDNIFINDNHEVAPGLTPNDAVVVPGQTRLP
jgi:hypothetical protein